MKGLRLGSVLASSTGQERVALVQGASRGIGLEYVTQLLARPLFRVIATCRKTPGSVVGLQELQKQYPGRCVLVQMDCTDEASIQSAVAEVKRHTDHLNLLINVAGVLHTPEGMKPEKAYKELSAENLMQSWRVNAMGPALVMKNFMELLVRAEDYGSATESSPAVIANMSASIGDNALGGWMSYRASKCALNQLTKCFSIELANKRRKVACLLLHPGTVDTDMSLPFQRVAPQSHKICKQRAAEQLLRIIESADLSQNGKFFAWDGSEVIW